MRNRPAVSVSPTDPILAVDEPPPVATLRPEAPSPFLLLGDHAGNLIPRGLDELGLDEVERRRHIAWDIGVAALGAALSERLDATFIAQVYSRLVIDCNRRPGAPDSIPPVSDGIAIAANAALDAEGAAARAEAIHAPYQAAIADEIERRTRIDQHTFLISLHSFTPSMRSVGRPWQVGMLYNEGDNRFARAMLEAFRRDPSLTVGDNQPYSMDTIDYTIPLHAYPALLPYVEIEIRQDLLSDEAGVADWCNRVEAALLIAQSTYARL